MNLAIIDWDRFPSTIVFRPDAMVFVLAFALFALVVFAMVTAKTR